MAIVKPEYYTETLTHITDIDKFFKYDEATHTMTFIGDTLEVRAQKRYQVYGLVELTETVKTLGILDLIIDKKYHASLTILAQVEMAPTEYSETTYGNIPYIVMTFLKGDIFLVNTQVLRNSGVIYAVYMEMISRGKIPYWFTYEDITNVFDRVKEMTGSGIGTDRVVYELVVSHLARQKDNLSQMYRYANIASPMQFIPIKSVAYAPTSTTARLAGSYFDDGLSASLLVESKQNRPLEDLFRGLPLEYLKREDPK